MEKICQHCKSTFTVRTKWSKEKREKAKWCSQACYHASWTPERRATIARTAANYLKSETKEQAKARSAKAVRNRMASGKWTPPALGKIGALRTNVWKDEEATYNAKHRWIQNHWQKTGQCEDCGKKPRPFGKRHYGTEWANLADDYIRNDRSGWKELCVPCHRTLDHSKRLEKGTNG